MLPYETTKDPNAVETHFCQPFEKLEKHKLEDEDADILIQLLMKDKNNIPELPENEKPFLYQVIEKRIKGCFTYQINDPRLLIFLCLITKNPGTAVMYLAYLQYWCKKHNVMELNLNDFCKKIFPVGFPSENDLHKLWDQQKVERDSSTSMRSDNLLDYSSAYHSIHFLESQTV